jgi:dsRNA-specific ribonuclease
MYKSRLQELCQQRRWPPPVFKLTHEGPDHVSLFSATVAVNSIEFRSLEEGARSAKRRTTSPPWPPSRTSLCLMKCYM